MNTRLKCFLIVCLSLVALWAAFYNGYPLFMLGDSAVYMPVTSIWKDSDIRPSVGYGVFRYLTSLDSSLWVTVGVQAFLVIALLNFVFLEISSSKKGWVFALTTAMICLSSSISLFASEIHPDIFASILFLSMFMCLQQKGGIGRILCALLFSLAMFTHTSHMMMGLAFPVILFLLMKPLRLKEQLPSIKVLFLTSIVTTALFVGRNIAETGAPMPYRTSALALGPLVESGLVKRYLDQHCPEKPYYLCTVKDNLPNDPDWFFWVEDSTRFIGLKESEERAREYKKLFREILLEHPFSVALTAVKSTARQLVTFKRIHSLHNAWLPVAYVETHMPGEFWQFDRSMQIRANKQMLQFFTNAVSGQVALLVALASIALLLFALRSRLPGSTPTATFRLFAILLAVFYVLNAFVCSAFARVIDRYQSRIVWLVTWTLLVLVTDYLASRTSRSGDKMQTAAS